MENKEDDEEDWNEGEDEEEEENKEDDEEDYNEGEDEEEEEEMNERMGRNAPITNLVSMTISPEGSLVIATATPGLMVKKPS